MSTNESFQPYPQESSRAEYDAYNAPLEQPPSIITAVKLMRAGAVVSLLGMVITLVTLGTLKDDIRSQLANGNASFTDSDVNTAFVAAIVATIVSGILGMALWLWMASANGKGRRWARIVSTVLGVINVLSFLYTVSVGQATAFALVFDLVNVVIGVATLVYLYRPEATRYYAATTR